jgi:hypothetical protein
MCRYTDLTARCDTSAAAAGAAVRHSQAQHGNERGPQARGCMPGPGKSETRGVARRLAAEVPARRLQLQVLQEQEERILGAVPARCLQLLVRHIAGLADVSGHGAVGGKSRLHRLRGQSE